MPILSALGGLAARGYGLLAGAGGVFNWSRTITNPQSSGPLYAAEIDSSGNIYGVGKGEVSGTAYPYIVAFNGAGALLWQKRLSQSAAASNQGFYGVSVDSSGNVYVSGNVAGSHMTKFDSSGAITWQYKQDTDASFKDVEVMPNGNIVFAGRNEDGTYDKSAVAVVNSSGTLQWNSFIQASSQIWEWNGVSVDSSSNIYCSGTGGTGTQRIIKFNSSGTVQFSRTHSTLNSYYTGNVYDAGTNRLYSAGQNDTGASITATNADTGLTVWAAGYGTGYYEDVDVDSAGNVYCLYQTSNIGEAGVHKYNSSGTLQWQRIFVRATGNNAMNGIKLIDDDTFVLTGMWTNNDYAMIVTLPTDGTAIATANWSWSASALTNNSVTTSSASNSGTNTTTLASLSATTFTASTPSYTWGSIVTY